MHIFYVYVFQDMTSDSFRPLQPGKILHVYHVFQIPFNRPLSLLHIHESPPSENINKRHRGESHKPAQNAGRQNELWRSNFCAVKLLNYRHCLK